MAMLMGLACFCASGLLRKVNSAVENTCVSLFFVDVAHRMMLCTFCADAALSMSCLMIDSSLCINLNACCFLHALHRCL